MRAVDTVPHGRTGRLQGSSLTTLAMHNVRSICRFTLRFRSGALTRGDSLGLSVISAVSGGSHVGFLKKGCHGRNGMLMVDLENGWPRKQVLQIGFNGRFWEYFFGTSVILQR